ncbi:hypothetical protein PVAP13_2KG375851 [Panicum virgatum]|uniref:Uncharacterized protein n=1 Tax=Panicum virgatum TaxID=38727 RepID=A0A8T0WHH4_PANVG|nr:hypothetical protein PVAP13_2KG375851 [Panicum virgatum]
MDYLLYLIFRCDRRCDGCDGKFGNLMGTKHTRGREAAVPTCSHAIAIPTCEQPDKKQLFGGARLRLRLNQSPPAQVAQRCSHLLPSPPVGGAVALVTANHQPPSAPRDVAAAFNTKRRLLSSSRARPPPPPRPRWRRRARASTDRGRRRGPRRAREVRSIGQCQPNPAAPPSAACSLPPGASPVPPAAGGGAASAPLHLPAAMATYAGPSAAGSSPPFTRAFDRHRPDLDGQTRLVPILRPLSSLYLDARIKISARGNAGPADVGLLRFWSGAVQCS